ncbi:hypothetical protein [Streptomyces sp. NPDC096132]|uniref:hypothetical protein n=1 Tax=Streptomyces sp. NPDC096132 TaxID=3366075 RepID=UPI00381DD056
MPGHEHDKPERYGGMDPLMAAITGDPVPDEARADPRYLAAHRSATADVALLREQLGLIADALTESAAEEPAPAVVRPLRQPRRRFLPGALRAVGVAAAAVLVVGGGWLVLEAGSGVAGIGASSGSDDSGADEKQAQADAGGPLGDPGYLACARLIVEGDVTAIAPVRGTDEERVTLRVTRSYKPAKSPGTVEFVMEEDVDPLLAEGDHVLVGFAKGAAAPDVWAAGEADIAPEREALTRTLPVAQGIGCE